MDGLKAGCPDDITLEMYLYEDLPSLQKTRVRAHLVFCPACRKRLAELRTFSTIISKAPYEEMPEGFVDDIVKSLDNWGDPTPVAAPCEEEDQVVARGPAVKVRWAMGFLMFAISAAVQWLYGDYLPGFLTNGYVTGLKGVKGLWEYVSSGQWWQGALQVVNAVRTDGLGALEILGTALPTQVAGVVVFGGIVTAIFVNQLRASRGKREGRNR